MAKKDKIRRTSIAIKDRDFYVWLTAQITFEDGSIENGLKRLTGYKA